MATSSTIKRLIADRGFGFIAGEDGTEYFFHRSGLDAQLHFDTLSGGDPVAFDIQQSDKGPRAKSRAAAGLGAAGQPNRMRRSSRDCTRGDRALCRVWLRR
jgi:CspA family cold shock protein